MKNKNKQTLNIKPKRHPITGNSKSQYKKHKSILRLKRKLLKLQEQAKIQKIPSSFIAILQSRLDQKGITFDVSTAAHDLKDFHNELIKNHSIIEGTKRFNSIRVYAIRLLEGETPENPGRVATGKKDLWPSKLNLLRPLFYRVRDSKCQISDQVIRSILYLNRLCKGNAQIDLSNITPTFKVSVEFKNRFRAFLKKKVKVINPKLELITKPSLKVTSNGPNAKPKWMTAEIEAYALIHSVLHSTFKQMCLVTGNNDLYEYMKNIATQQTPEQKVRLRYLTAVADKGNKSRLIAISDYWTQVLLRPLMKSVQNIIKVRYRNHCSIDDHNRGFELLKNTIQPGFCSYDIVSWTDVFPAEVQKIALEEIYHAELADLWYNLVVNCYWDLKRNKSQKSLPEKVKYGRGQGMGTAGSFDIATLTSLLILEMIYLEDYGQELGSALFNETGDDLWAYDPEQYVRKTLEEVLGMEISTPKTKTATDNNLVGEYVSRNINWGKDVSRISANICRALEKNPLDIPEIFKHIKERSDENLSLPLRKMLESAKIKSKELLRQYVYCFWILTFLYPERPGMLLLRYSIINDFLELYEEDYLAFQAVNDPETFEKIRNSYYRYSSTKLLNSIISKCEHIHKNAREIALDFKSLDEISEPANWWNLRNSVPYISSQLALTLSYKTHLAIYNSSNSKETNVKQMFNRLETIEQSLTFKDLGVISTTQVPWRPTCSRVFNFSRRLLTIVHQNLTGLTSTIGFNRTQPDQTETIMFLDDKVTVYTDYMLPSAQTKYLKLREVGELRYFDKETSYVSDEGVLKLEPYLP